MATFVTAITTVMDIIGVTHPTASGYRATAPGSIMDSIMAGTTSERAFIMPGLSRMSSHLMDVRAAMRSTIGLTTREHM